MDTIRVQTQGEEKFQEVLDVLRPLGVTVVTGTHDPIESVLFYIARMNSKFDNLGQLKHLHKPLKTLEGMALYAAQFFQNRIKEQQVQGAIRMDLWKRLAKERNWTSTTFENACYMSEQQIREYFTDYDIAQRNKE